MPPTISFFITHIVVGTEDFPHDYYNIIKCISFSLPGLGNSPRPSPTTEQNLPNQQQQQQQRNYLPKGQRSNSTDSAYPQASQGSKIIHQHSLENSRQHHPNHPKYSSMYQQNPMNRYPQPNQQWGGSNQQQMGGYGPRMGGQGGPQGGYNMGPQRPPNMYSQGGYGQQNPPMSQSGGQMGMQQQQRGMMPQQQPPMMNQQPPMQQGMMPGQQGMQQQPAMGMGQRPVLPQQQQQPMQQQISQPQQMQQVQQYSQSTGNYVQQQPAAGTYGAQVPQQQQQPLAPVQPLQTVPPAPLAAPAQPVAQGPVVLANNTLPQQTQPLLVNAAGQVQGTTVPVGQAAVPAAVPVINTSSAHQQPLSNAVTFPLLTQTSQQQQPINATALQLNPNPPLALTSNSASLLAVQQPTQQQPSTIIAAAQPAAVQTAPSAVQTLTAASVPTSTITLGANQPAIAVLQQPQSQQPHIVVSGAMVDPLHPAGIPTSALSQAHLVSSSGAPTSHHPSSVAAAALLGNSSLDPASLSAQQQQQLLNQMQLAQQQQHLKKMRQRLPHVSGAELKLLQKQIRDLQQQQQLQTLQTLQLAQKQEKQAFKYLNRAIKTRPSRTYQSHIYKVTFIQTIHE